MMTFLKADLPALTSAVAYAAIGLALARLFSRRHARGIGPARWSVLAAIFAQVALQLLLGLSLSSGRAAGVFALGASIGQLCIAISLLLLVPELERRLSRAAGARRRTGLALARQEADEAHAWLDLAGQSAAFGHWRLRLPERSLEWSDEMFRIHGLSPDAFSPALDDAIALLHADDRKLVMNGLTLLIAEGAGFEAKVRLRRPDGEMRHVTLRARGAGRSSILGVLVDVTDQKIAETRIREANMAALQANAALKEMTTEDELTGLANRRQFDLSLVAEFKRALRSGQPLGLVLIDLDHFKAYNELFGQQAGDACLRRVALAVAAIPRRTGDLVARFAGEEIAVLLPLADDKGAMRVATVIHQAIRALRIPHAGCDSGYISVSCGSAAFTGLQDMNNPLELLRRADQALYRAKTEGCDQVAKFDMSLNNETASPYAPPALPDMDRFIKSRA